VPNCTDRRSVVVVSVVVVASLVVVAGDTVLLVAGAVASPQPTAIKAEAASVTLNDHASFAPLI
jgi:hypothetical protein